MALTLSVTSYKNHAPTSEISVTVNETGCTIGRASDNAFVLPDMERIISHRHAIIQFENGAYYLTDNSTNGTFINHTPEPVGQGNRRRLDDGDIISIGEYDCLVSLGVQQIPAADSLLDNPMWQPPLQPAAQSSWEKEPEIEPVAPMSMPTPPSAGPGPSDYFQPPEAIPEDWDILTGKKLEMEPEKSPIAPEPVKKPEAAPAKPSSRKKRAVIPERKVHKGSGETTNLDQQAVDAFLAGAGLTQVKLEPEAMIDFMNNAGQLMREITQGFRQVLETRTSLKGEFRLGMTTIRPTENNPLKFSIDVEDALTKLLLPPPKGYLPPIVAIQEATDDLQAHQMALLAGLRAALSSLVALFDPEAFEKDFQKVSAVDNLLPFTKKAKCWELFKTRYGQAAADAENDFLHFLGDEFAIAYELQIKRLKSARNKK
jgi:type VI secretion system protein